MATDITGQLVDFARLTPPFEAREMMRLSLFDWAACAIAGAREVEFANFVAVQKASSTGTAQIVGGGSTSAPAAALINGTLSHALDYDDTHFAHIGHPSVAVVPAVLALADSLPDAIDAATTGVEASILVGVWLGRDHYQVGYHQTATAGAFGATLAAGRLLKLDAKQLRHALGLCASMASGVKAQFGTMAKPLNAGLAARSGIEAALWAQAGMTAAHDGLAGPLGFSATHHGGDHDVTLGWKAPQILSISHKFHACCHGLHATLEALSGVRLSADQVARIDIRTHPRWMSVCNIAEPQTGLAAKFSYAQTASMSVLGHDTRAIKSFSDAITRDADIITLRNRVHVEADERLSETQSEVAISLANGEVQRLRCDLLSPMSLETRAQKLRSKAAALLGADLAAPLWKVTQGDSLPDLLDLLKGRS